MAIGRISVDGMAIYAKAVCGISLRVRRSHWVSGLGGFERPLGRGWGEREECKPWPLDSGHGLQNLKICGVVVNDAGLRISVTGLGGH